MEATGVGTITYTFTGTFPDGIELSWKHSFRNTLITEHRAATSVTITATDEDNNTSDLFVNFPAVTGGGASTPACWYPIQALMEHTPQVIVVTCLQVRNLRPLSDEITGFSIRFR